MQDRLDGNSFAAMVRAGHKRLRDHVDIVNGLNVFPVPDGDTGTNMVLSLASGVAKLDAESSWTLQAAVAAFTNGLLMGARGNSGVILSQIFRGFNRASGKRDAMDVHALAQALHEGNQIAYRAVAKPVEGTILTVAREASQAGLREARNTSNLGLWMQAVVVAARSALARTPDLLPVLKQANVVDSGGQGLVFILEGFSAWLQGKESLPLETQVLTLKHQGAGAWYASAHADHESEYGYCTETLIQIDPAKVESAIADLRTRLAAYGDSLLVVGGDDVVKVHVHTLHPGRVMEDVLSHGPLVHVKVDNMTLQHEAIRNTEGLKGTTAEPRTARLPKESKGGASQAVVAVAAGRGLREVFYSLGADVVVDGGQTMNPSTEDLVDAITSAGAAMVVVLPNNKNIVMACEQARDVLGDDHVTVVASLTIPQGMAALLAYDENRSPQDNVKRMEDAMSGVKSGMVVKAVRDSTYQGRTIRAQEYLGLVDQTLVSVDNTLAAATIQVVEALCRDDAELITMFYGEAIEKSEAERLGQAVSERFAIDVEIKDGGQPVYDLILSME